jgi:hypothetical protein
MDPRESQASRQDVEVSWGEELLASSLPVMAPLVSFHRLEGSVEGDLLRLGPDGLRTKYRTTPATSAATKAPRSGDPPPVDLGGSPPLYILSLYRE